MPGLIYCKILFIQSTELIYDVKSGQKLPLEGGVVTRRDIMGDSSVLFLHLDRSYVTQFTFWKSEMCNCTICTLSYTYVRLQLKKI